LSVKRRTETDEGPNQAPFRPSASGAGSWEETVYGVEGAVSAALYSVAIEGGSLASSTTPPTAAWGRSDE
jgi:hypothetical protein